MNYWTIENKILSGQDSSRQPLLPRLLSCSAKNDPVVISVAGAGGKTSLIFHLYRECLSLGKRCLVTTTTHMFLPEGDDFLGIPDTSPGIGPDDSPEAASDIGSATIPDIAANTPPRTAAELRQYQGSPSGFPAQIFRKCHAPSPELLARRMRGKDVVLIEADGSRRLPLKIPAEYEPVIHPLTSLILIVYGLAALGKPLEQVCQRPELIRQPFLSGSPDKRKTVQPAKTPGALRKTAVTPEIMAALMGEYYIKSLQTRYAQIPILPVWNQADDPQLLSAACHAAADLDALSEHLYEPNHSSVSGHCNKLQLITAFSPEEQNKH